METAVKELQAAIGQGLNPALAESARALTAFIQLGKDGAGAFGGNFTQVIREATSAVIGLGGAVVVTGKYLAALGTLAVGDTGAWAAGWDDVKQTFTDVIDLQNKITSGGFAQKPGAPMARPTADLLPITLGGGEDKKSRGKTDADKAATQLASEQLSLRERINDAYDKALYSERQLLVLHMERAKLGEKERASLLERFDDTKLLEEDNKLKEDRLALDKQLQDGLDKQLYTERELLQKKMEGLRYGQEEIKIRLKQYDQEKQLREEAERRVEAEREAVRAAEEHVRVVERLMDKLEPQHAGA